MNRRGFAALGVHQPKFNGNVGGLMRAASCYGASLIVLAGSRVQHTGKIEHTDTRTAHRHTPLIWTDSVLTSTPHEATRVAVELVNSATSLVEFEHPESAYYIFGGEDRTLPDSILEHCQHVVYVPTNGCMNLAATANVVLYDRLLKARKNN